MPRTLLGLLSLALLAPPLLADAPPDPALARRVIGLIARLESDDYAIRETATLAIEELPADALPLIEGALAKGELSPEVAVRLADKAGLLRRKSAATKYEAMLKALFLWDRTTALAAYDKGGHADPKWDAAVHEAIVLHVRPRRDPNISPRDVRRIAAALKKAIDLGCDDPLVHLWHGLRTFELLMPGQDPKAAVAEARDGAAGVAAGAYPAYLRMDAAFRHADITLRFQKPSAETIKSIRDDLNLVFSLVGPALKEGAPRHAIMAVVPPAKEALGRIENGSLTRAHDIAMKLIAKPTQGTVISAFIEADFLIAKGYAIRNGQLAWGMPPPERDAFMAKTVKDCKAAVDAGLAPDPDDSDAVNRMVRYLCLVRAPAAEFDKWFDKAMALYPNDLVACQMKNAYLRENGTVEQRLAFGRQCLAGANWSSRIPLILCDVHADLGSDPTDPDVWRDLTSAYEPYFKRFPNAYADRSAYCYSACLAGQWPTAKAQFDALGDNLVWHFFNSPEQLKDFRERAAESAKP